MICLSRFGLAALLLGASAIPALADEARQLKISHVFPQGHFLWQEGGKVFVDTVEEATGNNLTFQQYHAGQLGKDQLALLSSGLADVVITATGYSPDKLPLSGVAELPAMYATSCEGADRFWTLAQAGGVLDQNEYAAQGIRVLFVITPPPFKVMTSRRQVSSFDELAGLKLRAVGGAQTDTVRAVGASPVQIQAPEIYDSVSRGTADGAIYAYVGMPSFDLGEVLHHQVEGVTAGSSPVIGVIRQQVWDSLTEDQKTAVSMAAATAQQQICAYQDREEDAIRGGYIRDEGMTVTQFSDADIATWNDRMAAIADDWATKMDANNRAGTAILEAWRGASD